MPILLLETKVTITLDNAEARSLRNALGEMSDSLWKKAGVAPEDQRVAEELFTALDEHFHK